MANFVRGETVICSVTVKNSSGTLVDPTTSMKITVTNNINGIEVDDQAMTKDSTGMYHYDWTSAASSEKGNYDVFYKATDGARISITKDAFDLI